VSFYEGGGHRIIKTPPPPSVCLGLKQKTPDKVEQT